jgi:hypothetical protein
MVLQDEVEINESDLKVWIECYIELLQRFQLWTLATDIINRNAQREMSVMNQVSQLKKESTTVHTTCPTCHSAISGGLYPSYACEKCKTATAKCSVCNLPVTTMYSWCQICSHGGHLRCMHGLPNN